MTPELPLCCRQCVHKQSLYLYPSWSHRCTKLKPMVEGVPLENRTQGAAQ